MLKGTTDRSLLIKYYEFLVEKVELDPKPGSEMINRLNIWSSIGSTPFETIAQSIRLSYSFSYLVFHCSFNLQTQPITKHAPGLIHSLIIAFNRCGED